VEKEGLPRDQPVLHLLLRMLALGLSAWEMIETQDFREPKLELPLLLQFLPAMMSLIVDDQVRCENLQQYDKNSNLLVI
jgi:negative elongation factor B